MLAVFSHSTLFRTTQGLSNYGQNSQLAVCCITYFTCVKLQYRALAD